MELSISSDLVSVTHKYPWETNHFVASGSLGYAYEKVNKTRTIGMSLNGSVLGGVKLNGYYKSIGVRFGNTTGHVELLMEYDNNTLTLRILAYGLSKLYSALGYLDFTSDVWDMFIAGWRGAFNLNASIQLIEPLIAGAAPLPECPTPV